MRDIHATRGIVKLATPANGSLPYSSFAKTVNEDTIPTVAIEIPKPLA